MVSANNSKLDPRNFCGFEGIHTIDLEKCANGAATVLSKLYSRKLDEE